MGNRHCTGGGTDPGAADLLPVGIRAALRLRAFSLIELLVVITISSVLFLSLSAALSSTLGTTAEVAGHISSWHLLSFALLQMEGELAVATEVVDAEDGRVSFYVPDITGDDAPDLVEYSWGKTAGDALVRTVNGASATDLLPQAREVHFSYKYRQKTPIKIAAAASELPVVPASFTQYEGYNYTSLLRDITFSQWPAQRFVPITDSHRTDSVQINLQVDQFLGLADLRATLTDLDTGAQLAMGILPQEELLAHGFGNLSPFVVPMTWQSPDGSATSTEGEYRWIFTPAGGSYAGAIERLHVTDPEGPDNNMMYEYSFDYGASFINLGNKSDVPFVTSGTYVIQYGINAEQTEWSLRRVCIYLRHGTGKNEVAINSAVKLGNL